MSDNSSSEKTRRGYIIFTTILICGFFIADMAINYLGHERSTPLRLIILMISVFCALFVRNSKLFDQNRSPLFRDAKAAFIGVFIFVAGTGFVQFLRWS
jgi:hypothetical protein